MCTLLGRVGTGDCICINKVGYDYEDTQVKLLPCRVHVSCLCLILTCIRTNEI